MQIKNSIFRFYNNIKKSFELYLNELKKTEHLFMMLMAGFIGLVGGFGAVGIKALISFISDISFYGGTNLIESISNTPWWQVILIPAIGGLIVGPMIYFLAPEAKGSGVPEVMASVLQKGGKIRGRVAFVKALASSITIGTGGSVGKEGPIIQIGSSLASTIGQIFKVPTSRLKVLVGCGAAAGIAGAFNAPVAGALFAIEIILLDFAVNSFSPIVISSVIATVVSHSFEGDFAAFTVTSFEFVSSWEVLSYIILGGISGIVSYMFIKFLYFSDYIWDERVKIKPYYKASIGGLIIGSVAIFFPEIMGIGYDAIDAAINGKDLKYVGLGAEFLPKIGSGLFANSFVIMYFLLIFIKIFTSSITLGSGGSGGVFAPSLFIGAMLGVFFGFMLNYAFPGSVAGPGAYALVAMGGIVAGTTRAPITAILIVFELTKENAIILPLMLTCIGSVIVSTKLSRESIYTLKLLQKNINVKNRAEVNILKTMMVSDIYTEKYNFVYENEKFSNLIQRLMMDRLPFLSVKKLDGDYLGMISLYDVKEYIFDNGEFNDLLIAADLANPNIPKVVVSDSCKVALEHLNRNNLECIPVMNEYNESEQIGMIWRKDIDYAYHKEIDKLDLGSDLASRIMNSQTDDEIAFLEGYAITEINAPKSFIGKSLKELKVRNKFGVDVLSIKQESKSGFKKDNVKAIPDADHIINDKDILIIAGAKENINKLKQTL